MSRHLFTTQLLTQPLSAPAQPRWRIDPITAVVIGLVAAGVAALLVVALHARPAAKAPLEPIILVATSTAAPAIASAPTTPTARAILARWDYRDPASAAIVTTADITRVVGMADDWRLVETTGGAQIWVAAADVPAGVVADQPLADLAPQPTPIIVYITVEQPWHPPLVYNDQAAADATAPCGGPNVVPPACH